MAEEVRYRPVPGGRACEYRVGDDGVAWSRRPGGEWKPLKSSPQASGHCRVSIGRGHENMRYVHNLVLEAFVGPCPPGLEACHKDDDPSNNRLDNLYWGTRAQNQADRRRNGRIKVGEDSHRAKLTASQAHEIAVMAREKIPHLRIAARYGVSRATVEAIAYGIVWNHVTGIPKRLPKGLPAPDA